MNASGSHHQLRKLDIRLRAFIGATHTRGGVYMYSNHQGCDGGRLYYGILCIFLTKSLNIHSFLVIAYISIYFTIGVDSIFSYAFETLKVNNQILRFSWSYMQMDVLLLLLMEI